MKKVTVTYEFTRLRLSLLIAFLRTVILKMTSSEIYPDPDPSLALVAAAADDAEVAMEEASDGDRVKIAVRNEKDAVLREKGSDLGAFVQNRCGNLVSNVLAAGFKVRKTPEAVGQVGAPTDLRLSYTGMPGEFKLRIGKVRGKLNYTIQKSESIDGPYETIATSSSGTVRVDWLHADEGILHPRVRQRHGRPRPIQRSDPWDLC
jgi:hypothetical protein